MKYMKDDLTGDGQIPADRLWDKLKTIFRNPTHLEIAKLVLDYITVRIDADHFPRLIMESHLMRSWHI